MIRAAAMADTEFIIARNFQPKEIKIKFYINQEENV